MEERETLKQMFQLMMRKDRTNQKPRSPEREMRDLAARLKTGRKREA